RHVSVAQTRGAASSGDDVRHCLRGRRLPPPRRAGDVPASRRIDLGRTAGGRQPYGSETGRHAGAYGRDSGRRYSRSPIGRQPRPLGNGVVQIKADGKVVFDSGPVTGDDEPRPVLVPIEGAKKIQLIVDYGDQLDVGDQADWGNARLIK